MSSLPDPSRIPDHLWEPDGVSADGMRRYYIYWVDKDNGTYFRKTENLIEDELLKFNEESLNMSYGQRFRDDAIGTLIASTPLNIYYRDIAPRMKDGDEDF